MAPSWNPKPTVDGDSITIDDIRIRFKRTILVPDNQKVSQLPPGLGNFSLHQVSDYVGKLPETMELKGGIFLPMYQREAMWIDFTASRPYALRIHVGGVNAISVLQHKIEEGHSATSKIACTASPVVPRAPRVEAIFFNPDGPVSKFRSVAELKKEVEKQGKPLF
ncbi:hypothetical protein E2P81_ATG11546 [Venturia nashicola]|uniref:Uncharacterized protein n=1 Tax=Venturia nashicola TaxID=86259 RepID=A0A4Z1P1K4_9PEZI|nr:hypothetical protein E6O75_ATG11237 [Venturia nashicola]TLD35427.1 hypothetical protein E2P81_ATG11546 [Venturia nashicola]